MRRLRGWMRTALAVAATWLVTAVAAVAAAEAPPTRRFDPDDPDSFAPEPDAPPDSQDAGVPAQRLRGDELRRVVPDLGVRSRPSPIRPHFGYFVHYPFQLSGGGLGVDFDATAWLTLKLHYTLGLLSANTTAELHLGHYGEAAFAVRVLSFASERDVNVFRAGVKDEPPPPDPNWQGVRYDEPAPDPFARLPVTERPELRAWLPSFHWVYLEAGTIMASLWFLACQQPCDTEDRSWRQDTRVLWFPFGGLRYVYFIDASSEAKPKLTRRVRIDVFAHVIGAPAGDSHEYTHWGDERRIRRTSFGGRAGFRIPTCLSGECPRLGLVAGYIPSPGAVLFALEAGN